MNTKLFSILSLSLLLVFASCDSSDSENDTEMQSVDNNTPDDSANETPDNNTPDDTVLNSNPGEFTVSVEASPVARDVKAKLSQKNLIEESVGAELGFTASWTASIDPDGDPVTYTVILGDKVLLENSSELSVALNSEDFSDEINQTLIVTASDGKEGETSITTVFSSEIDNIDGRYRLNSIIVNEMSIALDGCQNSSEISISNGVISTSAFVSGGNFACTTNNNALIANVTNFAITNLGALILIKEDGTRIEAAFDEDNTEITITDESSGTVETYGKIFQIEVLK